MISMTEHHQAIFTILANNANDEVALKSQRYFPNKINILGVSNGDVMHLADEYIKTHLQLTVQCRLSIAEELIAQGSFMKKYLWVLHSLEK